MRTLVEVVARCDARGRTVLPVVRASGQLAVRRTGPARVHLVATAFGPLGGDDVEIRLVVEAGARLAVHSVAAAVVLPAQGESPPSRQVVRAEVAGVLHLAPEPTVVTARADHRAELHAQLSGDAELTATEQVLLGRVGEEPGRWTGTTRVEQGGRPLVHTTIGLGPGAPAWLPPVAPRAYVSTVSIGGPQSEVATGVDAVRLPLPGGWVGTAWAEELHEAVTRLASVTPRPVDELVEVAR
ncbi:MULTISPECIES: urease accessory protein UreD [unclassified Modestobacter]|uniref:urease accessory protein UreD n=1 Tax=unclassified Modestobacter TaxID=2643866 RepID=UPI0022AAE1C4|nr:MULTISPECIES: urease accessory protein UreD [unclassified Modestobacter]MCZ2825800.1 urease accessory protein UreD [Modestobacter sp. VKM Ac-2981]MCZ2853135.1 urease accessory protein UreD [Modestobacter sp. VKM Ac-2982]